MLINWFVSPLYSMNSHPLRSVIGASNCCPSGHSSPEELRQNLYCNCILYHHYFVVLTDTFLFYTLHVKSKSYSSIQDLGTHFYPQVKAHPNLPARSGKFRLRTEIFRQEFRNLLLRRLGSTIQGRDTFSNTIRA